MPSSTDAWGAAPAPRADARPASFDRPLSGPGAARQGASWGDPILDAALADALENGRRQGLAHGFAAGWTAGRRAAAEREAVEAAERAAIAQDERRRHAARVEALLAGLADAARTAATLAAPAYEELADALADGALAIARAALARELETVDDDLAQRARTALRALAGDGHLVLSVNPADLVAVPAGALPADAELLPDPGVPAGAVVVRGERQRLLLDVPAAVAAAEEVLRS